MSRRNKGVEGRDASASAEEAQPMDLRVEQSLRAKAELYDKIAGGGNHLSGRAEGVLVDFAGKKRQRLPEADTDIDYPTAGEVHAEDADQTSFEAEYRDRKEIQGFIQSSKSLSSAARVKTQWERTMSREAKSFLDEVQKEAAAREEDGSDYARRKDSRREKLFRMQQQMQG